MTTEVVLARPDPAGDTDGLTNEGVAMAAVGDRVEVAAQKGGSRTGTVTATHDSMITVRWDTGGESSLIPGPGVITVLSRRRAKTPTAPAAKAPAVKKATAATTKAPAAKKTAPAPAGKAPAKVAAKKAAPAAQKSATAPAKKAAVQKSATAPAKKAAPAAKKAPAKKATKPVKAPARKK